MKLTTSDAAALFDVDESTIHRWVEERELPAERIAGRTFLNRAAVLEWATENHVAVSSRVFRPAEAGGEKLPSFAAALAAGGVHHGLPGSTRDEVLRESVSRLPLPEGSDAEDLLAFLLARETAGSSAIGDGIAIPHVRAPIVLDVDEALVSLSFLASPVDFGAADGRPVTVLFTMVTPTVHGHLHLLAALAYLLRDEAFRAAVQAAAPAEEVLALAAAVERRRRRAARGKRAALMEGASPDASLLLGAIALVALSGVPGLFARKGGSGGERLSALLVGAGGLLGLAGAARVLFLGAGFRLALPSPLPGGPLLLAADALSALFLVPVFLVPALGAVYGLGYWPEAEHLRDARKLRFFLGLLAASMAVVLLARSGVLFLVAWEVMALAAFFAATTEDRQPAVREAGWIYLVATHAGTLGLFGMTALLARATGSFSWEAEGGLAAGATASVVFLLALVGFGGKAGLFPFHFWLPGAHAGAPSHVSAVLSGVMLKVGLYGLLRVTTLCAAPPAWWGGLLLVLGASSALYGAALAGGQGDVKRLLAYSSIENVGIATTGIGLALLGRSAGRPEWVALGLGGALLHVLFHSLFKPLLFLGAGAVIHGAGTREMDELGGLLRRMPRTGAAFAAGCVAALALPPFAGFFSELVVYLGLFRAFAGPGSSLLAGFAAPALAVAGAVALAAFAKLYGVVFLGSPRSEKAARAHEPGLAMRVPILALALLALSAGLLSPLLAPGLDAAIAAWSGTGVAGIPPLASVVPLGLVAAWGAGFLVLVALVAGGAALLLRRTGSSRAATWDCGYARPTARMQYTGSSFGEWISDRLTPSAAAPVRTVRRPEGTFPREASVSAPAPARDPLLLRLLEPFASRWARRFHDLHALQEGRLTIYLVYVLGTLVALLAWSALRGWVPPL